MHLARRNKPNNIKQNKTKCCIALWYVAGQLDSELLAQIVGLKECDVLGSRPRLFISLM